MDGYYLMDSVIVHEMAHTYAAGDLKDHWKDTRDPYGWVNVVNTPANFPV